MEHDDGDEVEAKQDNGAPYGERDDQTSLAEQLSQSKRMRECGT